MLDSFTREARGEGSNSIPLRPFGHFTAQSGLDGFRVSVHFAEYLLQGFDELSLQAGSNRTFGKGSGIGNQESSRRNGVS